MRRGRIAAAFLSDLGRKSKSLVRELTAQQLGYVAAMFVRQVRVLGGSAVYVKS